jgi:molybdopterin molybdotransferase
MLTTIEAEAIILDSITPFTARQDTELIALETATGRILAETIVSKTDFPYWDNSAMDGYAVRYEDVRHCPVTLRVVEQIPAGVNPSIQIKPGQAARIFTGAMLPKGSDTIVMQEQTQREGNEVKILTTPQFQEFVRHRGAFYRAGMPLLEAGTLIGAAEIAAIANAQYLELSVYRRPRVAILSTGDELITPDRTLQPGQIIDSNQYALTSFVVAHGGLPIGLGIVPDNPEALIARMTQAINSADIVLSTGGVSVGDYDYVDRILAELGGKIHFNSVAVKPGKPLTVATFNNSCLYFGIPGNPVSALVSCWRFVLPAFKKLSGRKEDWQPKFIKAITCDRLTAGGSRETYLWGKLAVIEEEYRFSLAKGSHNSGNLVNLAGCNAFAVLPVGYRQIAEGETVTIMPIDR